MRWIVASSLRFRYLVVALALALMYFGAAALGHEKIDVFPEFAPVSVEIQTACLGLSPSEVESLTTVPLEAALQGVPGVTDISSYSEPQLSAIYLYFHSGTQVLHARQLVQERLRTTAPTLPSWCDPPQEYPIVSATSRIMQVGLTSGSMSRQQLTTIAQWTIRPKLMQVPGVANAAIWGVRTPEIMVEGDPAKMKAHGVPLGHLMTAAADAIDTVEIKFTSGAAVGSLGYVQSPAQRMYVRNIQPITTPRQMAGVPIAKRGASVLRVGQVAHVTWGSPPLAGDAVINGGPGLMIVVEKFPGANTLQVSSGVAAGARPARTRPARHPRGHAHLPSGCVYPDGDPQPEPVGAPRLHPGRVRADRVSVPVARRTGQRCWPSRCRWPRPRSCST